MNKLLLSILFFLLNLNVFGQSSFEPAYFIDNEGNKVECLIKNVDKSTNPISFEYKLSESAEAKFAGINDVQEFEILNTVHKYKRLDIKIDRSSSNVREMDYSREPEFEQEQLFLKVLIEGKASLYSYKDRGGLSRFFYKLDDKATEQLVYKKYMINEVNFGENKSYQQQLWNNLKSPTITMEQLEKVGYEEKDLVKLFVKYNEHFDVNHINYSQKKEKGDYNFSVKIGSSISALNVEQKLLIIYYENRVKHTKYLRYYSEFDKALSPQIGLEMEYVLPVNKKRWSVFFEPTFQYYKRTYEFVNHRHTPNAYSPWAVSSEEGELHVNYSHIMLPLGVKRYFFIGEGSKLFLGGAVAFNVLLGPSQVFSMESAEREHSLDKNEASMMPAFVSNLGYKLNNKYSIEVGYQLNKIMVENQSWTNRFESAFSVAFGYKVF
ncbi:hypothetical protein [Pontibacter cellulosilyticus]|uniref:Outer membrane protein beta-barrel domain-containing protein n=1 Tax=Pontibacter cellulosilyticus TaxID=1720253 RepID=A0A923NBG5_9BACT|nr:hypothetical protein [Pontibacter cellulosilyticus]MBC5993875.1 hypothetical protein [Pontibacter cellulosilyticus]